MVPPTAPGLGHGVRGGPLKTGCGHVASGLILGAKKAGIDE